MRSLAAQEIATHREAWHTLAVASSAQEELESACAENDKLRHAWRQPKGEFGWLKWWSEECIPTLIYSHHQGLLKGTRIRWTKPGTSAQDVHIEHEPDNIERLELTIAFRDDGYQEALRAELLNNTGTLFPHTPLKRVSGTVEYAEEHSGRSPAVTVAEWTRGISKALANKKKEDRNGYGSGAKLVVYGYGLSGDFGPRSKHTLLDDILSGVAASATANGFEQTLVMGWHDGWFRRVA